MILLYLGGWTSINPSFLVLQGAPGGAQRPGLHGASARWVAALLGRRGLGRTPRRAVAEGGAVGGGHQLCIRSGAGGWRGDLGWSETRRWWMNWGRWIGRVDGEGVKEATLIWEFHSLGLLYAACGRRSLVVPISANHQNQPISALTKRYFLLFMLTILPEMKTMLQILRSPLPNKFGSPTCMHPQFFSWGQCGAPQGLSVAL